MLAGLGYLLVPPVLSSVTATTVPDADTIVRVHDADGSATVTVPARWTVQRPFLTREALLLASPDGELQVSVTEVAAAAPDAFARLASGESPLGGEMTETLPTGARVTHASSPDGRVLVAAVGGAGDASVGLVARVDTADPQPYRFVVALLIDGVRVGP